MIISIIVAVSDNGVIGKDGKIPWNLPNDLKHFRELTTGHHVIMGQKTHESIGKPLPGRINIVLSDNPEYKSEKCIIAHSIEEALAIPRNAGEKEVFIIGGASVYREMLPLADKVYMTKVRNHFEGDTTFPNLDPLRWSEVSCEVHLKDQQNTYPYEFCIYEKKF